MKKVYNVPKLDVLQLYTSEELTAQPTISGDPTFSDREETDVWN